MTGMTGQQIYDNFKHGRGTDGLEAIAEELGKLRETYADRASQMKGIQELMSEAWVGDASAKARSGINPVMAALEDSAGYMDETANSMGEQSKDWHNADHAVEPVPPMPEKPNPWTTGLKAMIPIAGPFMASDDIENYQDGVAAHNKAAQHNVNVMNSYAGHTSANSNFPTSYGTLESSGSAIKVVTPDPPDTVSTIPDRGYSGGVGEPRIPAGPSGPSVASPTPGPSIPSGTGPPPPAPGDVVTPPAAVDDGSTSTSSAAPTTPHVADPGSGSRSGDLDTPASRGVPRDGSGGGVYGTGPGRPGGSTDGRSGGTASPRGSGSGSGRGTSAAPRVGGVPRGSVGGSADDARSLGSGRSTGAVRGGAAASEAVQGKTTTSSTGRGGGMRGMMPPAGGRGQGGEDTEHEKKTPVYENDAEELFGASDVKVTRPVIGE